jgi:protein-S-isoprenylcysteine O-methyltransferase Ste14
MITTILAYLLIAIFFGVIDRRLRIGQEAKSLDQTQSDRGSTRLIGYAFFVTGLALAAAPVLNYFQVAVFPFGEVTGWTGILAMLLGIVLRWWAFRTLGEYYTRTLRISADQTIVRRGPYKLIRHPGYLASLMMWLGAALATGNWLAFVIVLVALFYAYHYRIQAEEQMLLTLQNREYEAYRAHTWKLVPFIY